MQACLQNANVAVLIGRPSTLSGLASDGLRRSATSF